MSLGNGSLLIIKFVLFRAAELLILSVIQIASQNNIITE